MELEGCKELFDTGKSNGTWAVRTLSLGSAVLNGFQGFFGPKMATFGPKLRFSETEVRQLQIFSLAASFEVLAQTFSDCTSHLKIPVTETSPESEAPRWSSDFFPFRAYCLLAACLLNLVGLP